MLLIPLIWFMMNRSSEKGRSVRRWLIIAGLRSALVIVLAIALSDPRLLRHSDQVNVFFCLDVSESVSRDQQLKAEAFMKKAGAEMKNEDQAGLIVFGKQPSLETSLINNFESAIIRSDVNPNYTNIYEALQLALANSPSKEIIKSLYSAMVMKIFSVRRTWPIWQVLWVSRFTRCR